MFLLQAGVDPVLADANVVCHFGARECWLVSGLSCAPILFLCSFVGFVSVNWSHPSLRPLFPVLKMAIGDLAVLLLSSRTEVIWEMQFGCQEFGIS